MKFLLSIEKILFYLLFIALPFQTRYILDSGSWYFNEWTSISIYVSDVLIGALIVLWLVISKFKITKPAWPLLVLFFFSTISILSAIDLRLSFFHLIKLLEFSFLFWYLSSYALKKFGLDNISWAILAGSLIQAIIGLGQFFKQSDLGLRFLGESLLNPEINGVAVFLIETGEKVMRAYGTMPHPNVLAAYLMLGMFAAYSLLFTKTSNKYGGVLSCVYGILLFSFLATFSRTATFIFILASITLGVYLFRKVNKTLLFKVAVVTILIGIVFSLSFWPEVKSRMSISGDEEAVKLRIYYNKEVFKTGSKLLNINWTGVGIGNFVPWLMDYDKTLLRQFYQPVHNTYLLVYSEIGILGLIAFFWLLILPFRKYLLSKNRVTQNYSFWMAAFISVLFIAIFDHFFWTLQQGQFIFWLLLAILSRHDLTN